MFVAVCPGPRLHASAVEEMMVVGVASQAQVQVLLVGCRSFSSSSYSARLQRLDVEFTVPGQRQQCRLVLCGGREGVHGRCGCRLKICQKQ